MSKDFCVWEDCDQEPLYCEGHAREFVAPDLAALKAKLGEVERAIEVEIAANRTATELYDRERRAKEEAEAKLEMYEGSNAGLICGKHKIFVQDCGTVCPACVAEAKLGEVERLKRVPVVNEIQAQLDAAIRSRGEVK